jgi:Bacterial Ig-like domain (group 2)
MGLRVGRAERMAATLFLSVGAASTVLWGACTDTGFEVPVITPGEVDSVAVQPLVAEATAAGQEIQFSATALDSTGAVVDNVPVSWASSDVGVATVDEQGLATVYHEGETNVSATFGDATGSATLTVMFPLAPQPTASSGPGRSSETGRPAR